MNTTRHLLLALGLCVCLPATVRAQPTPTPSVVQRAKTLSDQKQFADARKLLEAQLALNPSQKQRVSLQNALADVHFAWAWYLRDANTLDREQAIAHYLAAYETDKVLRPDKSAGDLLETGGTYWDQANYPQAGKYWKMVVAAFHQLKDQAHEAENLGRVATVSQKMGHYEEAIRTYQLALPLYRQLKNRVGEASCLIDIGSAYSDLGRYDEVSRFYAQAFSLCQELKKPKDIVSIGRKYSTTEHYDEQLRTYKLALSRYRQLKDRDGEVDVLGDIGWVYWYLSDSQEALNYYRSTLSLYRQLKYRWGEAWTLGVMAEAYKQSHDYKEALHCSGTALSIYRQLKDRSGEAGMLREVGDVYMQSHDYKNALRYFDWSASIYGELKDLFSQMYTLIQLGEVYMVVGKDKETERCFDLAQSLARQYKDERAEAGVLANIGHSYSRQKHYAQALTFMKKSLPTLEKAAYERRRFIVCNLTETTTAYANSNQPQQAILSGKRAINVLQTIRADNQNMDKATQRAFLADHRGLYERVASLLVEQNRLEEAEQVLRFLRQEDAFEFVRRDPTLAKDLATLFKPLVYTPTEKAQLEAQGVKVSDAEVGQGSVESRLWQKELVTREKAKGGRAALISTFNTDKAFYLILTTAKGRQAFSVPIKKSKFDALSLRLQSELSEPTSDVYPDAQKMYEIVFANGKLESALQKAGITTALWFAAGSLRYIPIDALYDGKQYLVQKPRANVLVTLTSRNRFDDKTKGPALAAGVSQAHIMGANTNGAKGLSFPRLSNVPKEVRSVVRDTKDGGIGPFSGKILLDKQFTEATLERALAQGASAVHVATHFFLGDGSDSNAFLLLGDGKPLPISQWKKALKLKGVGLLTLSACETGVGNSDATGGEVSSIGEVSQWLGAQSVIVSLWPVADSSTGLLMHDFYTRLRNSPQGGKAQALRQAQRALLGTSSVGSLSSGARGRPLMEDGSADTASTFVADPAHPYAHPYYWAPFSLIGNWK